MDFIPAQDYATINYLIVLLLTILYIPKYRIANSYHRNSPPGGGVLVLILFIVFIGYRPISEVFADMRQYQGIYERWDGFFIFDIHAENVIYDNLMYYFASISFPPTMFYPLIACIYYSCTFFACRKLFNDNYLQAFIVFLGAFSTFSYGTNGIKAGAAAAIFLLAIAYRKSLWLSMVLAMISLGFHHAMQLPIVAFISSLIYKNSKVYFVFWCFCLLMAVTHISSFQALFANLSDEKGMSYLNTVNSDWGGKSGIRIDFIIYSAMPVLIGYYAIFHKKIHISDTYKFLLNMYLITNGVWMLCMYANYTNRIAYLSWFMYPIVLIYPYLNEKWGPMQYVTFTQVAFLHLGFSLFMHFIYY